MKEQKKDERQGSTGDALPRCPRRGLGPPGQLAEQTLRSGEWYGVRTDEITGRVWALDLPSNGLQGRLTPCLGELDELVRLDLSVNSLEGPIPPELANCRKLKILMLRDNDLEGRIPGEFGRLRRLEELALDNNRMDGSDPGRAW